MKRLILTLLVLMIAGSLFATGLIGVVVSADAKGIIKDNGPAIHVALPVGIKWQQVLGPVGLGVELTFQNPIQKSWGTPIVAGGTNVPKNLGAAISIGYFAPVNDLIDLNVSIIPRASFLLVDKKFVGINISAGAEGLLNFNISQISVGVGMEGNIHIYSISLSEREAVKLKSFSFRPKLTVSYRY